MNTIYTIGWERSDPVAFIELLQQHVKSLIDVRANPFTRFVPAWNPKSLRKMTREYNIDYFLVKEMGIPSRVRKVLKDMDRYPHPIQSMKKWYKINVINQHLQAFLSFIEKQVTKPYALMCYERDASQCHRSVLADAIVTYLARYEQTSTIHLMPELKKRGK